MLNKSDVIFNQEAHTYHLDGVRLEGITGMIGRQLFPDKYKGIPDFIIENAGEKGSAVHAECEIIDSLGVGASSDYAKNYVELKKEHGIKVLANEYIVTDRKHFASPIDIVGEDFSLYDIKTTSKFDADYVRWQLSIYAYLFELQNPELKAGKLYGVWLRPDKAKLEEVERIPAAIIIDLLTCEVEGRQFVNPLVPAMDFNTAVLLDRIANIEARLSDIKFLEMEKKALTDELYAAMEQYGVEQWVTARLKVTRVKPTTSKGFDKAALKKDDPETYSKYETEVPKKGYLKVTPYDIQSE